VKWVFFPKRILQISGIQLANTSLIS
jgi:hypothetical protein